MFYRKKQLILLILFFVLCLGFAGTSFALKSLPPINIGKDSAKENISLLQENLAELKLYNNAASGIFDDATLKAVNKLQEMLNQKQNDICDIATAIAFNMNFKNGTINAMTEQFLSAKYPLYNHIIGIDAGHQETPNLELEPIAPNSIELKERMSAGALGIKTGIAEHETNLLIAKKLKKLLEKYGATVIMTRTKNDVNISNAERAIMMNKAKVEFWVRVHCDYSTSKSNKGVRILIPNVDNAPFISESSLELAQYVLPAICKESKAKQLSIKKMANQTAFNYSNYPVITIEYGYLSNPDEDILLNRDYYQELLATGTYNGILAYIESTK